MAWSTNLIKKATCRTREILESALSSTNYLIE
jgi:hypothetical protein